MADTEVHGVDTVPASDISLVDESKSFLLFIILICYIFFFFFFLLRRSFSSFLFFFETPFSFFWQVARHMFPWRRKLLLMCCLLLQAPLRHSLRWRWLSLEKLLHSLKDLRREPPIVILIGIFGDLKAHWLFMVTSGCIKMLCLSCSGCL